MIHIGFTGTRHGMTEQQLATVPYALTRIALIHAGPEPFVAHHGDRVGADSQFHRLCRARGYRIVGHPPLNGTHRAHCEFDEARDRRDFLVRNRDIVKAADYMIATPADEDEQTRGGTWSTVRFARKWNRPLALCLPSGRVKWERWPNA